MTHKYIVLTLFLLISLIVAPNKVSAADNQNYWPMDFGNWWEFGLEEAPKGVNCGLNERSTFYVQPPDLINHAIASRTVVNYKTDRCMYNWPNYPRTTSWHIGIPPTFKTIDGETTAWMRQWGIKNYLNVVNDSDPEVNIVNSKVFNLPFNNNNNYSKPLSFFSADMRVKAQKSQSQDPYSFFPYNSSAIGNLLQVKHKTCLAGKNISDAFQMDADRCRSISNREVEWQTFSEIVNLRKEKIDAIPGTGNIQVRKVTFFEQSSNHIACENWYYAPNIGPVMIHAAAFYPISNKSLALQRCKNFDFSANQPNNNQVKSINKLVLKRYSVPSTASTDFGYNSPAGVMKQPNGQILFADNDRFWTYSMKNGMLTFTGKLEDVWGNSGSKAPGVKVGINTIYPYKMGDGKKYALVYSPELVSSMTGTNGEALIFNQGAYWVQQNGGKPVWKKSGLTWQLLKDAKPYVSGSQKIYPYSNYGPQAAATNKNNNGIVLVNQGVSWVWNSKGIAGPYKISDNPHFKNAPTLGGQKPFSPESMVQFHNGEYLSTPTAKQQIIFQNGAVWINYNGKNKSWQVNENSGNNTPSLLP